MQVAEKGAMPSGSKVCIQQFMDKLQVCIHVCTYVCIYATGMHTCMYVCMYICYRYAYMYVFMYVCMYICYRYAYMYVCIRKQSVHTAIYGQAAGMHTCVCVCMYVYFFIFIHRLTGLYGYVCISMCMDAYSNLWTSCRYAYMYVCFFIFMHKLTLCKCVYVYKHVHAYYVTHTYNKMLLI